MNRGLGKNSLKRQRERTRMRIKNYGMRWVRPSSEMNTDDKPLCSLMKNGRCALQAPPAKDLPGRFPGAEPYHMGDCQVSEE